MPNSFDPWLGASASLVRVEALMEEPWYWVCVLSCAYFERQEHASHLHLARVLGSPLGCVAVSVPV